MRTILAKRPMADADRALSLRPSTLAPAESSPTEVTQARVNEQLWARDHVARYANRSLHPVEVLLLARYHQALSGRVLEAGCGAGRILGYLVALGGEAHGVDTSLRMLEYCRHTYPEALLALGDLRTLPAIIQGPFDAIVAAAELASAARRLPRRIRNQRRLASLQRSAGPPTTRSSTTAKAIPARCTTTSAATFRNGSSPTSDSGCSSASTPKGEPSSPAPTGAGPVCITSPGPDSWIAPARGAQPRAPRLRSDA
jgi:Methyltransferase domain